MFAALLAGAFSLTAPAALAAPAQPSSPSLPEGPWPPSKVLAADPATVHAPRVAGAAATSCPPAGYGVHYYAPGGPGRTVALTFDDGPGTSTAALLQVLRNYGVPATFFNIGINQTVRPSLVQQEAADGFLLGNHTWSHPDLATEPASVQAAEMDQATAEQISLVGRTPCVFRPPYGSYNSTTLALAQARNMSVWNWSVDTEDWKAQGSASSYWVNRIISLAEAGGSQAHPVVLMHNQPAGNPATVAALPTIIQFYRDRGYTFVDLQGASSRLPDISPVGVAAARTTANSVVAFVRGTDGAAWYVTDSNGAFGPFGRIPSGMIGGPAAVSWDGQRIDLFVVGTDRALWHTWTFVDAMGQPTAFAPWQSLSGILTTSPAVASLGAGRLAVAGRGTDGSLWSRVWDGTVWSPWQYDGGTAISAPALDVAGAGYRMHVVGTDGKVWSEQLPAGGPASGWAPTGLGSTIAPAASATASWASSLHALAVGLGAGIRQVWPTGPVIDIGGIVTSAPALVEFGTTSTWTFARGADNALWVNQVSGSGASALWFKVGGVLA